MTTDERDGEIRRALNEIGDAAGTPPRFVDVSAIGLRRRSRGGGVLRCVAFAAATAAAVTGIGLVVERSGSDGSRAVPGTNAPSSTANEAPVPVDPAPLPDPATVGLEPDTASQARLRALIAPALPDGFEVGFVSPAPLYALAYDVNGVRLQVVVDIGGAAQARAQITDALSPVPGGQATADGRAILTDSGDVVSAFASYGGGRTDASILATADQAAPAVAAAVAAGLDESTRALFAAGRPMRVGARGFVADLDEALAGFAGGDPTSAAGLSGSGGDITRLVDRPAPDFTSLAVTAYRSAKPLADAVSHNGESTTVTRWAGGWQLVLTSLPQPGQSAPWTGDELSGLAGALAGLAAVWTPTPAVGTVCGTYALEAGDSESAVAQRFGITVDELMSANPDLLPRMVQGTVIDLPCDGTAEQLRSSDATGLDDFRVSDGEHYGFRPNSSVTVASDRTVWVVAAGTDTGRGLTAMLRIETYDRASGALLSDWQTSFVTDGPNGCSGPLAISDDPDAPLRAIPFRCVADGAQATVDVFSGITTAFER